MRLFYLLMAVGWLTVASAGDNKIYPVKVFNALACTEVSTNTVTVDLDAYRPEMTAKAIQLAVVATVTGSPNVAVTYTVSADGVTYAVPVGATDSGEIVTNLTGSGFYQFDPGVTRWLKFTAITTVTNAVLTGTLAIQ